MKIGDEEKVSQTNEGKQKRGDKRTCQKSKETNANNLANVQFLLDFISTYSKKEYTKTRALYSSYFFGFYLLDPKTLHEMCLFPF